jgi:hypothetical protein
LKKIDDSLVKVVKTSHSANRIDHDHRVLIILTKGEPDLTCYHWMSAAESISAKQQVIDDEERFLAAAVVKL